MNKEKSNSYYYGYGLFKGNIYYWSNIMLGDTPQKLKNVDKKTFTVLSGGYAKDKNHVYYENKILPGADPKDFRYDKESRKGYSGNDVYDGNEKKVKK